MNYSHNERFEWDKHNIRENIAHSLQIYLQGLVDYIGYTNRHARKGIEIYKYLPDEADAPSISIHVGDSAIGKSKSSGCVGIDRPFKFEVILQVKGVDTNRKNRKKGFENYSKTDLEAIILHDIQHSRERITCEKVDCRPIPYYKGTLNVGNLTESFKETQEKIGIEYNRTLSPQEKNDTKNTLDIILSVYK